MVPELNLGIHSLRAGGASTIANSDKVDDRCLMLHGRWKSHDSKSMYVEDYEAKKLRITEAMSM